MTTYHTSGTTFYGSGNVIITTATSTNPQSWNGPPGGGTLGAFQRYQANEASILEERRARLERQERPPSHWWVPDASGRVCGVCDFDNIYRGVKHAHVPLIKEDPEPEDWWRELGAA